MSATCLSRERRTQAAPLQELSYFSQVFNGTEESDMAAHKRWTIEDIVKLRSMAGVYPAAVIAAELGRGLPGTVMKAHGLRISLRVKVTRESRPDPGPAGMDLTR